jgi:hypothetical protein
MKVLAACLIFSALVWHVVPAEAQDWPTYTPRDPDDLVIRESSEGHFAEIAYDNSHAMSSQEGDFPLEWQGETIIVSIKLGGQDIGGAEIVRVTPPDTLIAVPDYAEVLDGAEPFIFQIMQAMF